MPSFVIVNAAEGANRQSFNATLCDPGPSGSPDRRSATPVNVQVVNDRTLAVDDVPRRIISSVGMNGAMRFLVEGSTRTVHNAAQRRALARASELLRQLAATLMPITRGTDGGLTVEALGMLFNVVSDERERLTAPARSTSDEADEG